MTTYHLEQRVPRKGERILSDMNVRCGDPNVSVFTNNGGAVTSRYVLTEDRPKSDHPEALLIRADDDLWVRITPLLGDAYYQRLYCLQDGDNLAPEDITEWEDVYDEAPEPEPEHPTADVIRITGIDPDHWHAFDVPTIAIRQHAIGTTWYRTTTGFSIDPEHITAWDDIDTNGDSK